MSARNFPVTRPDSGSETGFTFGLTYDIGKRLEAAGYPPLTGADHVELMQALFRFLYGTEALSTEHSVAVLDEDQPAVPTRGHGKDDTTHYAHAMIGPGAETSRCGAVGGRVALFMFNVTCPRCVHLVGTSRIDSYAETHAPMAVGSGFRGAPLCGAVGGRTVLAAADATCSSCRALLARPGPDADAAYTDDQLAGTACSVCGVDFAENEATAFVGRVLDGGGLVIDDGSLQAHPDCLTPTPTEPLGDVP